MMRYFYKLLAFCLLLPLFQSNATVSDEQPKPKSNARKALDCVIPAPTILKSNCLNKIWDKRFGGNQDDYFSKTIKLSDGYLLAGTATSSNTGDRTEVNKGGSQSPNSQDYWIVKVDNNGNKIWDKSFGGSGYDYLTDIIKLSDGNFVLAGISNSGIGGDKSEASKGDSDFWIVKIDGNGNKIWDKTYGGDNNEGYTLTFTYNVEIKETNDGLILGGSSKSGISGNKTSPSFTNGNYWNIWILKLNQQGNKIWDKTFGGTDGELFRSIVLLENNQFAILGRTTSPSNSSIGNKTSVNKGTADYWVVRIDNNGNKIWDRSFGGSADNNPRSMIYTGDGKLTIAGSSTSPVSGDKSQPKIAQNNGYDIWIIKVDTSGNKIWDKTYGTILNDEVANIIKTNQGEYIISSYSDFRYTGISTNTDYNLIGIDDNGNQTWSKIFGSTDGDYTSNVVLSNNELIVGGTSFSGIGGDKSQISRGGADYWLVKMNYCQSGTGNPITICKNDSVLLQVQGCPNGSTFKWSNGSTEQTISVKPSITTTYKAICISTNTGCQSDSSLAFTVNVNIISPPTVSATSINLCIGESTTLTASGCQGTYGWTGGATTTSITVNPIVTKTYKVACTFNGCTSDSTTKTITVNPLPTKPIINTQSQNICVNSSIILSASGCNNGIYQWTGGLTGSSVSVNPTNTISTYKVACRTSSCLSDSSNAVTIVKPTTPIITPPTNSTVCKGNNIILSATGCTGGTYTWTGGLTGSSVSVSPIITSNYIVTCTINSCVSNNSAIVQISVISMETNKSGSWTDPTTWSCNRVPTATDDVIINVGHTITNTGGTIRAKSLNYRGGILQLSSITNLLLGN